MATIVLSGRDVVLNEVVVIMCSLLSAHLFSEKTIRAWGPT